MSAPNLPATLLGDSRSELLARVVDGLDSHQLYWLSGYAAGLAQRPLSAAVARELNPAAANPALSVVASAAPAALPATPRLTLLYGSQTGNARRVAEQLAARLKADGRELRLVRASDYNTRELKDEKLLLVVVSTQGEGEPPEDSVTFFNFLNSARAPKLPQLKYAVFGLGDSSYAQFCAYGKALDARLAALGAQSLLARVDTDVDFETPATQWQSAVSAAVAALAPSTAPQASSNIVALPTAASTGTREQPFAATLLLAQKITARNANKDVRHIELSLEGSGIHYQPGDALGVWPVNPQLAVDAVLSAGGFSGDEIVTLGKEQLTLREALRTRLEITQLSTPVLKAWAALARNDALNALLGEGQRSDLQTFIRSHQFSDLLRLFPARVSAEQIVSALRPLAPRLYSIASSQSEVGEEVHLTIAVVDAQDSVARRVGAASFSLAHELEAGASVPVFIEKNDHFRLPADAAKDVIMIGPGTGVAPFRAFVQERAASGASGRNWLFFGEQHFESQFLYQTEWQAALKSGALTRLDTAFSRDQAERIYVQHKISQHAAELVAWLDGGAHLYVCGDATRMAPDVHAALRNALKTVKGCSDEQADDYLNELKAQGRYQRDVY